MLCLGSPHFTIITKIPLNPCTPTGLGNHSCGGTRTAIWAVSASGCAAGYQLPERDLLRGLNSWFSGPYFLAQRPTLKERLWKDCSGILQKQMFPEALSEDLRGMAEPWKGSPQSYLLHGCMCILPFNKSLVGVKLWASPFHMYFFNPHSSWQVKYSFFFFLIL